MHKPYIHPPFNKDTIKTKYCELKKEVYFANH